jgi:hypothetical protein
VSRIIKIFSNTTTLEYNQGRFNNWCIYLTQPDRTRYAPKDQDYFTQIQQLSQKYGGDKIYNNFVEIYNKTTSNLEQAILNFITQLSGYYHSDSLDIDIIFTILYARMVAEENKLNAILKKRIKRLGVHQVLIENFNPTLAANFSKGKQWRELDLECKKRGF